MWFEWPYTDLHSLNLDWILNLIKQWQGTMNDLPEYIKEEVQKALEDANFSEIVAEVLSENGFVLNVKMPGHDLTPAKGDGVTDDTAALTAMIDFAFNNNYPLLFPAGQYLVSGLTVSTDLAFIGFGAALFLKAGAVNPLITVKDGYLTATGVKFNGNIAGQANPRNVFVVEGGGFDLKGCTVTGGVDGIHANIDRASYIQALKVDDFTEYGIYVEGRSFINANGITMDVASGGALRFMRVDASNCVFNGVESLAEVAIAFEVTGDFNYFLARVPNAENPVSDGGQNNSFEIIAQLSNRTYQNLSEKVAEDYTQEVGDFDGTATGHYSFSGPDVILNPTNPLTYGTPENGKVPYKTPSGTIYHVLTDEHIPYVSIKDYGAVGDGATDDFQAITNALNDAKAKSMAVLFPFGRYFTSQTLDISGLTIIGQKSTITGKNLRTIISASNVEAIMDGIIVEGETCQTGITYYRLQKGQINNCEIRNLLDYGIEISESKKITITHNEIHDIANQSGIAFSIPNTSFDNEYIDLSFNKIYNIGLDGVSVQGFSANIAYNVINNVGVKTPAAGIYATNLRYSKIVCNAISACAGNGIDIAGDDVNNLNVDVSENSISTVVGSGVLLQNGNGFRVENNFIYKVGYDDESLDMDLGLSIRTNVYYVYAIQNHFADCKKGGIYLKSGSGPLTEGFSNFEGTAVQFKSDGTASYNKIDFTQTQIN